MNYKSLDFWLIFFILAFPLIFGFYIKFNGDGYIKFSGLIGLFREDPYPPFKLEKEDQNE